MEERNTQRRKLSPPEWDNCRTRAWGKMLCISWSTRILCSQQCWSGQPLFRREHSSSCRAGWSAIGGDVSNSCFSDWSSTRGDASASSYQWRRNHTGDNQSLWSILWIYTVMVFHIFSHVVCERSNKATSEFRDGHLHGWWTNPIFNDCGAYALSTPSRDQLKRAEHNKAWVETH